MKIAIYTRVSTDTQADKEFNSCEAQEQKIRSFVSSQENMAIYKVYSDQGYTGANTDRPALMEMLNDIQNSKIDLVLAYKIDRLTRAPKDFYQLIEIFEQHKVTFISVTERFDTSTPSGRLLRNIMLTFAQFERELISERTRDKMLERAKKGFWNSGHTPFGYKRENKRLIIEPKEADIVKTIFETYLSTGSTAKVYKRLKADSLFNRQGIPISHEEIRKLLMRAVYIGQIEYQGNIYQGLHDPIISKELFDAAKCLRKERVKKSKVFNYSLFPGLVHCKDCGSVMSAVFSNKIKGSLRIRYFYYRCSSVTKRDNSFCDTRHVSSDRLDSFVIENLNKISKNPQYLESLIFTLNYQQEGCQMGIEPEGSTSPYTPERLKEILQNIAVVPKFKTKAEKEVIIKKHIKQINYSKEAIEVVINYSDCGAENLNGGSLPAAGVWAAANAGRRTPPQKQKTANPEKSTVRSYNLVALTGVEPVFTP